MLPVKRLADRREGATRAQREMSHVWHSRPSVNWAPFLRYILKDEYSTASLDFWQIHSEYVYRDSHGTDFLWLSLRARYSIYITLSHRISTNASMRLKISHKYSISRKNLAGSRWTEALKCTGTFAICFGCETSDQIMYKQKLCSAANAHPQ